MSWGHVDWVWIYALVNVGSLFAPPLIWGRKWREALSGGKF